MDIDYQTHSGGMSSNVCLICPQTKYKGGIEAFQKGDEEAMGWLSKIYVHLYILLLLL